MILSNCCNIEKSDSGTILGVQVTFPVRGDGVNPLSILEVELKRRKNMMTSKDLEKKLAGKKILWRPTFIDVTGTKQYEDLLVGDRRKGFMPDVWQKRPRSAWKP